MPAQNPKPNNELKQKAQIVRPEPFRVLLEWKAPTRPFKKRDREYFTTIGAMVFLLAVIFLFLQEWLMITVMIALVFVAFVMGSVPPEEVEHKITNQGIVTGGRKYRWQELDRFWFSEKWGQKILHVETLLGFPRKLVLLLGETPELQVKRPLAEYLPFEEPEKSWVDKASEWLSRWVPLERTS